MSLDISKTEIKDIREDIATAVKKKDVPMEYIYALLLQFGDERMQTVVQSSSDILITPSKVYALLASASHYDGLCKGRLKNHMSGQQ